MIKIGAVAGNANQEIRIFFWMMIGVQQHFPVNHIGLKLHSPFFEIRAEYAGKIGNAFGTLKQGGVDGESDRRAIGGVFFKIDTSDGIER